ncbi:MAG: TonB-dependent receptor [Aestuariibacter sp.]
MKFNLITLGLALSFSAVAQQSPDSADISDRDIETIVVTSDFRQLTVDKLPASASVISSAAIKERQAVHLEEVFGAAANVNVASGASRGRFVQIRGIGERSQFAEPINPSVGFVIDDLDFSGTMGVGTLFDIQQVEVLKGPQGTTFGSSAMAGIVKIQTKEADGAESGEVSLSVAEQATIKLNAAYGNQLTDKLNFRAAVQQYQSDGYIDNLFLNRDDTDDIDELSARLKLRYLASDNVTFDFALHAFDIDNGFDAFSLDNTRQTLSDQPGFDRQDTLALSGKVLWQLDSVDVIGALTHSNSDIDYGYDEDWTFDGFHPIGYSSVDYYFRKRDTDSLDVKLRSKQSIDLGGNELDWVIGVFAKNTDESLLRQYTFADSDFTSDYSTDSFAAYGEAYIALNEDLTLTTGLRIERSELDYSDSNSFDDSVSDTLLGGRLVLDYQASKHVLLYAGINRGFKLGGFNPDPRVTSEQRFFEPEYNWNYEAGVKQTLADGDGFVGFSIFYMDRTNTQIADFATEEIDDSGATSFIDIIDNADVAKNFGAEFEARYYFTDSVDMFVNLGLLEAKFQNYTNAKGELIPERDQAQAPSYTFNVGLNYRFGNDWKLRIEADGKDGYYFSDGHNERSKEYTLFNASLTKHWRDIRFDLWGKNLFDQTYYTRGFGGFSNDPRDGYFPAEPYYQIGNGRMLGVTATYQF